jgi:hypothetical protein
MLDAQSQASALPVPDLENELHALGLPVGERILELMFYREKGNNAACSGGKREVKVINMLYFV